MNKKDIIENFILYYTSDDDERNQMRVVLDDYLDAEEGLGYNE